LFDLFAIALLALTTLGMKALISSTIHFSGQLPEPLSKLQNIFLYIFFHANIRPVSVTLAAFQTQN
jgi:hypothetical protein